MGYEINLGKKSLEKFCSRKKIDSQKVWWKESKNRKLGDKSLDTKFQDKK